MNACLDSPTNLRDVPVKSIASPFSPNGVADLLKTPASGAGIPSEKSFSCTPVVTTWEELERLFEAEEAERNRLNHLLLFEGSNKVPTQDEENNMGSLVNYIDERVPREEHLRQLRQCREDGAEERRLLEQSLLEARDALQAAQQEASQTRATIVFLTEERDCLRREIQAHDEFSLQDSVSQDISRKAEATLLFQDNGDDIEYDSQEEDKETDGSELNNHEESDSGKKDDMRDEQSEAALPTPLSLPSLSSEENEQTTTEVKCTDQDSLEEHERGAAPFSSALALASAGVAPFSTQLPQMPPRYSLTKKYWDKLSAQNAGEGGLLASACEKFVIDIMAPDGQCICGWKKEHHSERSLFWKREGKANTQTSPLRKHLEKKRSESSAD